MSLTWERGKGAQDKVIADCPPEERVIAFHTKKDGRGWSHCSTDTLLSLCSKNNGLHEVLNVYPKKVYFDVDFKNPPEHFDQTLFLNEVIDHIRTWLPDIQLAISGSVCPDKASFHLIAQNYIMHNDADLSRMKKLAMGMSVRFPSIDWVVYTKNRQMKLPNQSKPNRPIQTILDTYPLNAHIISAFFKGDELTLPQFETLNEEASFDTNLKNDYTIKSKELVLKDLPNPEGVSWDDLLEQPETLLSLIPNGPEFPHSHSSRVGNFCYWNNVPKAMFLKWLSMKDPSNVDRLHKYNTYHWDRYKDFLSYKVSTYRMRSLLPNWYPNIMPKDRELHAFQRNWYPQPITHIDIPNVKHLDIPDKFILFTNPMGKGKTNMLIEYLPKRNFLWVAPRTTLVDDTVERMQQAHLKATHYGRLGTAENKKHSLKYNQLTPNPVMCLNSLYMLWERDIYPDVIILDEIETMLTTLCGEFIENHIKRILWRTLKKMIQYASKVVCLDAFITMRTVRFLRSLMQDQTLSPKIYDSLKPDEPVRHVVELTYSTEKVMQRMSSDLAKGKRLIVFYPYKKGNDQNQGMNDFVDSLYHTTVQAGLVCERNEFIGYHGDSDQHLKRHIKDVNQHWATKRLVCFNNIITAGVSYVAQSFPFDDCYLFVAPFNDPRDIAQASYRARQITSKTIYLKWLSGFKPDLFANDTSSMPNEYKVLYDDTVIEKKCPNKHLLMMFFQRANYAVQNPMKKILKEDCVELIQSSEATNMYSWESIADIDKQAFKDILQRTFLGDTVCQDKLCAQKYVFRTMFKPDTPTSILQSAWDDHKSHLQPLFEAIHNEDSFEMRLAKDNDWEFFPYIEEPTRKWDVKLSSEVKDKILSEWTFLRMDTDNPNPQQLLRKVYNHKYGSHTIEVEKDKHKHFSYATPHYDELQQVKHIVKEYYQGSKE